jgi:hypothetical protein
MRLLIAVVPMQPRPGHRPISGFTYFRPQHFSHHLTARGCPPLPTADRLNMDQLCFQGRGDDSKKLLNLHLISPFIREKLGWLCIGVAAGAKHKIISTSTLSVLLLQIYTFTTLFYQPHQVGATPSIDRDKDDLHLCRSPVGATLYIP